MCKFFKDEHGAAVIEYSLLMSLIGLSLTGVFYLLGSNLVDTFSLVNSVLMPVQVIEHSQHSGVMKDFLE